MLEIIKLLLPIIVQLLPVLINKPKPKRVEYFEDLKRAALADRKFVLAVQADTGRCLAETWDDAQWAMFLAECQFSANVMKAEFAAQAAKGAQEGGAA